MTQPTITKIENGKIVLPKKLQKKWLDSEVILFSSRDSLYIKKIFPSPSLSQFKPKLKKLGKILSQKEIDEAIKQAQKKIYQSCS
ncbi:hypothetical protein J7J39_02380 [bacterium]|nr:hypothetical protein [bacterium]